MLALFLTTVKPAPVTDSVALLIGVTSESNQSPANDCQLVKESLLRRGWSIEDITVAAGEHTEKSLVDQLNSLQGVLGSDGTYFVYISSPGLVNSKVPALDLFGATYMRWDTILGALSRLAPAKVELIADTGYTNLLYSFRPPNTSILSIDANVFDRNQNRAEGSVVHNGKLMRVGVLSYMTARELPFSTTMRDLAYRVSKAKDSGSMAAIWADLPRLTVWGNGLLPIPGTTTK